MGSDIGPSVFHQAFLEAFLSDNRYFKRFWPHFPGKREIEKFLETARSENARAPPGQKLAPRTSTPVRWVVMAGLTA